MDVNEWKQKNIGIKRYAHFDKRVCLNDVWEYISDSTKVVHHSFYPFIHYKKHFNKYNKKTGIKSKERELCYSAHIDRCIYQYYGYLLNQMYNNYTAERGFSDSAVAYRDSQGKNNIHFSKQAFDFIREQPCYVIVGDFTHFFDELDHKYLKRQLCNLLNKDSLPDDYYAVYKNITRYSTWNLTNLLELNNLEYTDRGIKELNSQETVLSKMDFKANKKKSIQPHKDSFGIPQGSAISAVLSNIYMLELDEQVRNYADMAKGLYLRYSDDFILILPDKGADVFKEQLSAIRGYISDIPRLVLQPDKTQIYYYSNKNIQNRNKDFLSNVDACGDFLNYLGFTFDGNQVLIRDKTLSKYYYRMYRKVKTIVKADGISPNGKKISCKNLYLKYSEKGAHVGKGNFISYVQRAEDIFGKDEGISRGTKKHMQKIRKQLRKIENNRK